MSTKPLKAVALRLTSELKRRLEVLERRIDFDRTRTLSLLSVRAVIQTELDKGRCENRFPWKAPTATGELLNSTNILILLLLGIYLIEYID